MSGTIHYRSERCNTTLNYMLLNEKKFFFNSFTLILILFNQTKTFIYISDLKKKKSLKLL